MSRASVDGELLEQTLGGWDHDGDRREVGGEGRLGASPVQSLQPLEGRSATHIQLSACPVPPPPPPLRPSQSSFFFRSEVRGHLVQPPGKQPGSQPLLKLSCHCILRCPPMF